jgi:hypothetical protein
LDKPEVQGGLPETIQVFMELLGIQGCPGKDPLEHRLHLLPVRVKILEPEQRGPRLQSIPDERFSLHGVNCFGM